jgi:hypothetical protein
MTEKEKATRQPLISKDKNDYRDKYTILSFENQTIRAVFYRKEEQDGKANKA